jgi:hypothetical protein
MIKEPAKNKLIIEINTQLIQQKMSAQLLKEHKKKYSNCKKIKRVLNGYNPAKPQREIYSELQERQLATQTFSGSCKAIQMLVATSTFSGRERLATAGMHLTAFKQAILT